MATINSTWLQVNPQAAAQGNIAGEAMAILGKVEGTLLKASQQLNKVSQAMLRGNYKTAVSAAKMQWSEGEIQAAGTGVTAAAGMYQGCSQAKEMGSFNKESSDLNIAKGKLRGTDDITGINEGIQGGNDQLNETNLPLNKERINELNEKQKILDAKHKDKMQYSAVLFQTAQAGGSTFSSAVGTPFKAEQGKFQAAGQILMAGERNVTQAEGNAFSTTSAINQAIARAYDAQAAVRAA